jgi:putative endonuclease
MPPCHGGGRGFESRPDRKSSQKWGLFAFSMYTVYIIYSESFDSFYIGFTSNIEVRLLQHNSGQTKSTKAKVPWRIVYTETFETSGEATRRERFLKKQKNKTFYKKLSNLI